MFVLMLFLGFPLWRGSVQQCTCLTKLSQWILPLLATSRFALTHAYCYASSTNLLIPMSYRFPQSNCFSIIHKLDQELQTIRLADPRRYPMMNPGNCNLIVYAPDPRAAWHIVKPDQLLDQVIHWYHQSLNHVGMSNLFSSIAH
jgi:hypothetical protein